MSSSRIGRLVAVLAAFLILATPPAVLRADTKITPAQPTPVLTHAAPTGAAPTATRRPTPTPTRAPTSTPAPARTAEMLRQLTVVASGDVLLHEALHRQAARDARAAGRPGYLFDPIFSGVQPVVTEADVAICHLETPLGRPNGPFTGYPRFVVPPQVAATLARIGYDSCSTASNHTIDDGEAGVYRTLDALDAVGLRHAGSHRSAAEANTPTILNVRGVKVAHLSYTSSLNGLRRPPDKPWLVNELRADAVLEEARQARATGAEIVIASLHWGTEYQHRPNPMQLHLARLLLGSPDIDLILGHHAHVVQPFERIGDKWVVYGMGNHVAWQHQSNDTRDGVLARMTFREVSPGRWRVVRAEALPTWMHLANPARLLYVPSALADPTIPPSVRAACFAARQRIATAVTSRGGPTAEVP
ncbi:MAG TPA: CapA family protein [Jiangellales bacterium]|nr:CapA family protein [Jiangellales bacterium]